ncbi:O-antigen ligase family protein [Stutzerimonas azotifigens]|uniref:O-antigen ligase family protein n=1 Tax=Stutzerimonas azotifigens TaxID=291995 RepID=UPI001F2837F0|nr:O-antigen ligase family protein [Stutzerimonas azotifigens]
MQPRQISPLIRNPLIFAFIIFASYIILTLLWSDTDTASFSLLKRPIYVLTMLLSAAMLAMERPPALGQVMKTSAVIAAVAAALSFGYYLYNANFSLSGQRFSGYGALYNPLLSAHVYGFFATFWLAYWFTTRQQLAPMPLICLAVLGTAIIATGSRTPLLALSAVAAWLGFAQPGRRSLLLLLTAVGTGLALLILHPASLISRGLSYRPDIWSEALALAAQRPWLGYGFDHQLLLELKQAGLTFNDPHNIELAVLLAGGLIGLALWFLLYGMAILYSWRNRHNSTVLVASSLLIFGFFAGLTEGRDFLSRPKEHWFLIWIPFALLINAWLCSKRKTDFSRPPL